MISRRRRDRYGVIGELPLTHNAPGARVARDLIPAVVAALTAALLLAGTLIIAPRHGFDTWGYVRVGKEILRWLFHGHAAGVPFPHNSMIPNYIIPSLLIGAAHAYFGGRGTQYFIYLNIALFTLMVFVLFRLWRGVLTSGESAPVVVVGGLYIIFGLVDVPLWNYYDLSDMLFMVWVGTFIYFIVVGQARGLWSAWVIALALALAAYFVRPTGILLPGLWLLALMLAIVGGFGARRAGRIAFVASVVMAIVALMGVPWFVGALLGGKLTVGSELPLALRKFIGQAVVFYREGWVVADRANTYVSDPHGYLDFLRITLSRFGYYFIPLRLGYSPIHNILNGVYFVVLVAAVTNGFRTLARRGGREVIVAWTLVMFSLCYGLLHAVTLVSYDWRYQLPAMVPAWLLAGVGITGFRRRLVISGSQPPHMSPTLWVR